MIEVPMVIWLPLVTWAVTSIWDHRDTLFGFDEEEKHESNKSTTKS